MGFPENLTRRGFLATAGALAVVPRNALGGEATPPSDTVTGALIGNGGQGKGSWGAMGIRGCRLLAICDVDYKRVVADPKAFKMPPEEAEKVAKVTDFRRLMEMKDLDVVCIATPPHWHALICIAAAQAGKDIFCEKPMTKFIAEGRAVVNAVKRYGVVFQIGTFGRYGQARAGPSLENHKLIKHGLLKELRGVVQRGTVPMRVGRVNLAPQPVPANLDYDLWLGPAPFKPYNAARVHYSNRFYWDYEGGDLTNFGAHRVDPFTWTFAKDDTAPVAAEPHAPPAHDDAVGPWGWVELTYADGLRFIIESGKWGNKYDRPAPRQTVTAKDLDDEGRKKLAELPNPEPLVSFAEAIRTRKQAGGNAEAAHRGVTALHLANIAIRVGRRVRFDPVKEQIVGDEAANRLVDQPMREPWHLPEPRTAQPAVRGP
ncbi:MAG: Gfo/Idh/MocA family oxidoreductase [Planctomycetes bacterium]|nr:Gfo/Idh/MocA family oxidoreductase [Planctomycetota bacterium]